VDLVCLVVDALAPGIPDEVVLAPLRGFDGPVFCVLNKVDLVRPKARILPLIDRWRQARAFDEIVPVSAIDGSNCDQLLERIVRVLPEHPPFFPADATSDQPETFWVAEVIRERVFRLTRHEVPYATAVRVESLTETTRPARLDIRAMIFVEQESQKGIMIGRGGLMLKRIGTEARGELERFFGVPVFLGLTVQVRKNWRRDERALREFGFRLTS
jgi:GTP-binding protein Era